MDHAPGRASTRGLNFVQQKLEADFRYAMVRLRETAESVAFYDGAARERGILSTRFGKLIENTIYIIKKQKQLSWLTNSYGQIAIIFPFVVAAPRYLSKHISLGGLMQVANCFGKVQESMSYFVDVYSSLAEWQSCVDRLLTFDAHMEAIRKESDRAGGAERREGKELRLTDVEIAVPGGRVLCRHLDAVIHAGRRSSSRGPPALEIDAPSCTCRVLAHAKGEMILPDKKETMFIPQKPYMPMGTLAEAAQYPDIGLSRKEWEALFAFSGLSHLIPLLDSEGDWSHILSG